MHHGVVAHARGKGMGEVLQQGRKGGEVSPRGVGGCVGRGLGW